jgi:type VI secretion system protein ImpK
MSQSDPHPDPGNDDRTIIRPSPGGRKRQRPADALAHFMGPEKDETRLKRVDVEGSNPLIEGAFHLLSLVPKLRNLPVYKDIPELHKRLVAEIQRFESRALQKGVSEKNVGVSKYFLCSLIDETVLHTPWGGQGSWGHNSLSVHFLGELWGGAKFFQIIDGLKQKPAQNLNLLELGYLCLSLGFEGQYRNTVNGWHLLENERSELYRLIQSVKGDPENELSTHWQGLHDLRNPLSRYVPLWVLMVVATAVLTIAYLGFAFAINRASDRVYDNLIATAQNIEKIQSSLPQRLIQWVKPPPSVTERFRILLADEIARNSVEVLDGPILRLSNAFSSGSADIRNDFLPMLAKIAQELQNGNYYVNILGHTDNRPIKFSARFKSNYHLSYARAENVANILSKYAPLAKRISFEGKAAFEPVIKEDTESAWQKNRRVDIHIR